MPPPPAFLDGDLRSMSSFMRVLRLQGLFRSMSEQHQKLLIQTADDLHQEDILDESLSKQLHNEILATMRKPDGVESSPLYYKLPTEIRAEIFSYLVVVPEQIHIFAPYDNDQHGYRLSICGEDAVDPDYGRCRCENGRPLSPATPTPEFLDTALLLVSKSIRREVLDVLFTRNHFTFTSLRDIMNFSTMFKTSASKLQHLQIYERADDYPCSEYRAKQIEKTRKRIGILQSLDIRIYLCEWTSYEKLHEDAFLNELVHFSQPPPKSFSCSVRYAGRFSGRRNDPERQMADRVATKLTQIFTGKWPSVEDVPFSDPPPNKVREEDKPLASKKGIIVLRD